MNQQNVLLRYELVRAEYDGQAVSGDFHSNDSSYDTNNIKELAMIYQYNVTKQINGAINSKMNARFAYREVPLQMVSPYMKAKNHVPLVLTNPVSVKMYRTRYEKAQADEIADKQYIGKLRKEERKRIVATASSKNGDTGELLADIESLKQNEILKNSLPIQWMIRNRMVNLRMSKAGSEKLSNIMTDCIYYGFSDEKIVQFEEQLKRVLNNLQQQEQ